MLVVHRLRQMRIQRATANLAVQEHCETRDTPHTVKRKRLILTRAMRKLSAAALKLTIQYLGEGTDCWLAAQCDSRKSPVKFPANREF